MTVDSELKIKIVNKIKEIPRQDWEKVFPRVLENYNFFKTLDDSNFPQFSFFYIMVYEKEKPVGATSCFIMNFPLDIAVEGAFKKTLNFIKRFSPSFLSPKILICGLPMGQGRIGIAGDPKRVIPAICKGMEQIAQKKKIGIIAFKDFVSDYKKMLDISLDRGFLKIHSLPSTDMDITFSSFDHYLKSLSSVSRSGLKRKFKEIDGKVKIDLEIKNILGDDTLKEVHALYLQTYEKQDLGLEKLTVDFFRNVSKNMPDETKFFLWKMDNKLVAFAFCLVSGEYFIDYYLGFDYSVAHKYHLYSVRFRDLLNWCIQNKIKKYEMGVTSYEPKRRLGFKLFPLYIYVKHRNKFFNPIFRAFSRLLQPANFHPIFKELKKS
ncbi:MAG: GNAT family N-acetyltransferase [Candidatus Omnitrophica bacterium]|nr:GNAT family N-acetyltransferase [Candidatus Omnitrophota bacterium]